MTFSEQFKDIFNMLCEKIGVVIDWTQDNIIPYLTELFGRFVTYKITTNAIGSVIFFGMLIFGIVGAIYLLKDCNKSKNTRENTTFWEYYYCSGGPTLAGGAMIVAVVICFFIGILGTPIFISELLKWIIVPEFQLVEMISNYLAAT